MSNEKVEVCKRYLQELPEDIRDRALSQLDEDLVCDREMSNSRDYAIYIFSERTVEGDYFWYLVANKKYDEARALLKANETMYEDWKDTDEGHEYWGLVISEKYNEALALIEDSKHQLKIKKTNLIGKENE